MPKAALGGPLSVSSFLITVLQATVPNSNTRTGPDDDALNAVLGVIILLIMYKKVSAVYEYN